MGDWPDREDRWGLGWTISPGHPLSLGGNALIAQTGGSVPASTAWPAANRAILIPFRLPKPATVYKITIGAGATAAGNFDVGIYDASGNRIVSGGTTAKGDSTEQTIDITDTLLGQGLYYMAMSADGTNNYIASTNNVFIWKLMGVRQASSAFVLPATVTFETLATAFVPMINLRFRSY